MVWTQGYGVNARFYFQDQVLNGLTFVYIIILFCTKYLFQSNLIADSDGVVWFGFYIVWIGLEWFMLIYLIKIVWCGFGLDPNAELTRMGRLARRGLHLLDWAARGRRRVATGSGTGDVTARGPRDDVTRAPLWFIITTENWPILACLVGKILGMNEFIHRNAG